MNSLLSEIISKLGKPSLELNENNIKRIQKRFPVPNDYKILWADIIALNGHPAGVVVTKQALIVKASQQEVKRINDEIAIINKELPKSGKKSKINYRYRIIPWENYDPESYTVEAFQDAAGNICYQFYENGEALAQFVNKSFFDLILNYNSNFSKEKMIKESVIEQSTLISINTVHAGNILFNATYNSDVSKTGHGNYAERASSILDILNGERSSVVGMDNAKNGPDKIVNSMQVQCKYCKTPYYSINACFEKDELGHKRFRYYDLNGAPMRIEVSFDQYSDVVEYMKKYILDGNVPGVSNPEEAYNIIRRGKITYNQARNLARSGTIEAIVFDTVTGAYESLIPLGLSAVVTFAKVYWNTRDVKKATKCALSVGIQVFGFSLISSVFASQLARTSVAALFKNGVVNVAAIIGPTNQRYFVNAYRAIAGKKPLQHSARIPKSFDHFISSNLITEGAIFAMFALPDTYMVFSGKISSAQYTKNMLVQLSSCAGSYVGTTASGALLSKASRNMSKISSDLIYFGSGMLVGWVISCSVKALLDLAWEDDAIILERLFNSILTNMQIEYMLSDEEQNELIEELDASKDQIRKVQQQLLTSSSQSEDVRKFLKPRFDAIVRKRTKITESEVVGLNSELFAFCQDLVGVVAEEGETDEM